MSWSFYLGADYFISFPDVYVVYRYTWVRITLYMSTCMYILRFNISVNIHPKYITGFWLAVHANEPVAPYSVENCIIEWFEYYFVLGRAWSVLWTVETHFLFRSHRLKMNEVRFQIYIIYSICQSLRKNTKE